MAGGTDSPSPERRGMGVIQSEPLGPGPGLARPQDSYLDSHGPPPASPLAWAAGDTSNGHFRF